MRMDAVNPKLCELECGQCGFKRRFTINAKYASWLDDPLAVKEQLHIDYRRMPAKPAATNGQKQQRAQPNQKERRAAGGAGKVNVSDSTPLETSKPVTGKTDANPP